MPLTLVITGVLFAVLYSGGAGASGRAPTLPDTPYDYDGQTLPGHFAVDAIPGGRQSSVLATDNTPDNNPTTDAGATLGRVLFYDTNLSANGTVSCASCHVQEFGFSDPLVLSLGFDGGTTRRNSMGLANAAYFEDGTFFWDERAATLEDQVLGPFQDPVEMGLTLAQLESIVDEQAYYDELFVDAFGDSSVTSDRISLALSQFVRSIVTTGSRYDDGRAQVTDPLRSFPNFDAQENQGKALFFRGGSGVAACSSCHVTEAFVNPDRGGLNNGLDLVSTDDLGLAEVTGRTRDEGRFKTPSLRNISLTAPYMHDGRFATLEEVVEHYSTGVQDHPNLSGPLDGPDGPLLRNFTEEESAALVAFLHTLTDEDMITNEAFSDPFVDVGPTSCADGYFLGETDGDIYGFGDVESVSGDATGMATVVDIAAVTETCGWLTLHSDGTVTASVGQYDPGNISMAGLQTGERLTAMSVTPDGRGAWAFTNIGRVLTMGTAELIDDGAGHTDLLYLALRGEIIDSVVTPDGAGLYMLGDDGGIFTFGTATYAGSVPGLGLTDLGGAVVGLVPDPDGSGYWAVAADGGVFAFDADFRGSFPALGMGSLNQPIVGMVAYGNGYLQVASDGGVFNFSNRAFSGSLGASPPNTPVVAISPSG
ncbi:MAG: hypothetical protein GY708_18780 [Actinomycetia bacterium]|nr:hypothetical protein [Actinomycetes bacterium]MCP4961770.1 hypothetical protein [Actinomycetes bacterium]